jgi:hypothetical protein
MTTTNEAGEYTIAFTPAAAGELSVVALAKTLSPPIQVEDNTDGDAIWAVGRVIDSASPTRDLHATHGWNWTGASYDAAARIAAPFAILDSMYTAAKAFLAVRSPVFPALKVNWSPGNVAAVDASGYADPANGLIGNSHYSPGQGEIYILGKDGDDTDEFDSHVIVHEWAHYFEDNLSRTDSPGGSHGTGDVLDPRLAFGEGYASALAAMLLPEAIYADTGWWGPGSSLMAFGFDAETAPNPTDDYGTLNPGPFSEMSIIRAVYDLWDSGTNEAWDNVAVGLGPIYDVLVGPEKTTDALTTIASFITGLRAQGVDGAAVNNLLAHYSIGPISDEWGTGDTDLSAMFKAVDVPSTDSFTLDGRYDPNMQQQNQYLVFTATGASATVTSSSAYDVDLYAYASGVLLDSDVSYDGNETLNFATTPGQVYVVVLNGWGDVNVNGPYSATVSISSL